MADRPILFSGPMVKALLDGRKTQTRRVVKRAPWGPRNYTADDFRVAENGALQMQDIFGGAWRDVPLRFSKGDRLYVRETWAEVGSYDPGLIITRADYPSCVPRGYENVPPADEIKWRVSIHMPRQASRLTLTVTDVRVQRLQECSKEDAAAEGLIKLPATGRYVVAKGDQYFGFAHFDPRVVYAYLWDCINGEGSWDANPWVVAVTFTVERRNIDA